jgi:hypothetical protein
MPFRDMRRRLRASLYGKWPLRNQKLPELKRDGFGVKPFEVVFGHFRLAIEAEEFLRLMGIEPILRELKID